MFNLTQYRRIFMSYIGFETIFTCPEMTRLFFDVILTPMKITLKYGLCEK